MTIRRTGLGRRLRRGPNVGRGQSLVEFALVIPVIILLIVAFAEIGRAVFAYNAIANAARQGARVAAVNQLADVTECDTSRPIEDPYEPHWTIRGCTIAAAAPLRLQNSNVAISYAAPPSTTLQCSPTLHVGCLVTVTVVYHFSISTPFISALIGPFDMVQTSEMPVERVFP